MSDRLGVRPLNDEAHVNRVELELGSSVVVVNRSLAKFCVKSCRGHFDCQLVHSLEHHPLPSCPMLNESESNPAAAELERLKRVLEVAKRNGNTLFIDNIEREILAVERGDQSPLITDYLTQEERSGRRAGHD